MQRLDFNILTLLQNIFLATMVTLMQPILTCVFLYATGFCDVMCS